MRRGQRHHRSAAAGLAYTDALAGWRPELAALLARAALRLHARAALAPDSGDTGATGANNGETLSNLTQTPLDLRADKSVHGDHTVDAPERARHGGTP